jgi:LacI family transcriptional regulator
MRRGRHTERAGRTGAVASIKDVARKAGVSIASVSRVMNDRENVGKETRERVMAAVRSLRYVPHSGARSLITRRTSAVGVLLPDLFGEFFSEFIRGIDAGARRRGLQLLLSSVHGEGPEVAAAILTMRGRVDGLLIMSPHVETALLDQSIPATLPLVLVNSPLVDAPHPTLTIDSYRGARAMVRHLIGCGHTRIAHIAGPVRNFDADQRLRGYRDEMARSLPDCEPLVLEGDFSERSGHRAGSRLADRLLGGDFSERSGYRAGSRLADRLLGGDFSERAGSRLADRLLGGDFSERAGYRSGSRLAARLAVHPASTPPATDISSVGPRPALADWRPDAVFASNDMMAVGCLVAFREAGLRVPDDIAVAGFDDIPLAALVSPALTTARVHIAELGRRALDQLLLGIENPQRTRRAAQVFVPELVIRESCGAANLPERRLRRPPSRTS